jgi:hypothetical protein
MLVPEIINVQNSDVLPVSGPSKKKMEKGLTDNGMLVKAFNSSL